MTKIILPELLAPAGNMEKAKTAIAYGADALYLAGKQFGMRASAGNFDLQELGEIISFAHKSGVRIYVTVNTFPHNAEVDALPEYLLTLQDMGVDAIILADVGVYRLARKHAPNVALHLSTQANTVNWQACLFWQDLGFERVVLARELSRDDISAIRAKVDVELEMFVHGAMCMAYSGRCLLSKVMTGRDANRGACAQSCRWKYTVMEENRPGEYFPIWQDQDGTHLFNSKDLRLIEYLPEIIRMGVHSLKIEGRMKSAYYVATVVRAYRESLDGYARDPEGYVVPEHLIAELEKVSHRPYYPGFFVDSDKAGTYLESSGYDQTHDFVGVVEEYNKETRQALVNVRNRLAVGDLVEVMQPKAPNVETAIQHMTREKNGEALSEAHANYTVNIPMDEVKPYSILRIPRPRA